MTHKYNTSHSVSESERRASRASLPPSLLARSLSRLSLLLLLLKVGRPTVGRQRCCSPLPSLPPCRDQRQTPQATFRTATSEIKNDLAKLAGSTSKEQGLQTFTIHTLHPLLWRHYLPILSPPSSCEELRRFGGRGFALESSLLGGSRARGEERSVSWLLRTLRLRCCS